MYIKFHVVCSVHFIASLRQNQQMHYIISIFILVNKIVHLLVLT